MDVSRATTDEPSRRLILIAEDDVDLRQLLASALRSDGHEVEEAATGFALLARASVPGVSLIVSDVHMPGMTGPEVLAGLRGCRRADVGQSPIILITAFGDSETHLAAERLGAVLFDKPFDLDDLRTCVMNMLSPEYTQARKEGT